MKIKVAAIHCLGRARRPGPIKGIFLETGNWKPETIIYGWRACLPAAAQSKVGRLLSRWPRQGLCNKTPDGLQFFFSPENGPA